MIYKIGRSAFRRGKLHFPIGYSEDVNENSNNLRPFLEKPQNRRRSNSRGTRLDNYLAHKRTMGVDSLRIILQYPRHGLQRERSNMVGYRWTIRQRWSLSINELQNRGRILSWMTFHSELLFCSIQNDPQPFRKTEIKQHSLRLPLCKVSFERMKFWTMLNARNWIA